LQIKGIANTTTVAELTSGREQGQHTERHRERERKVGDLYSFENHHVGRVAPDYPRLYDIIIFLLLHGFFVSCVGMKLSLSLSLSLDVCGGFGLADSDKLQVDPV
jgi:hypothetical protein